LLHPYNIIYGLDIKAVVNLKTEFSSFIGLCCFKPVCCLEKRQLIFSKDKSYYFKNRQWVSSQMSFKYLLDLSVSLAVFLGDLLQNGLL